jgi:hypothetical protein
MNALIVPLGLWALTAVHPFAGIARPQNHVLAVPEMGAQTSVRSGVPDALPSSLGARALSPIEETGRPGRTIPFVARRQKSVSEL